MRKLLSTCLLLLVWNGSLMESLACINSYESNDIPRSRTLHEQLTVHELKEPWATRRQRLRREIEGGADYKVKNDLAVALMHTGEVPEAILLLEQIEAEKPGLYLTAANLGTAHELAGDNQRALEWIKKGIHLNPDAHEGSEWLHVRILEAKIALESDPHWFASHRVLGMSFKAPIIGELPKGNRDEALSLEQIKNALTYQLHERLQFVKAPDVVVGNLLVDLGHLVAQEPTGAEGSRSVFAMAENYLTVMLMLDSPSGSETSYGDLTIEASQGRIAATPRVLPPPWWRDPDTYIVMGIVALPFIVLFAMLRVRHAAIKKRSLNT